LPEQAAAAGKHKKTFKHRTRGDLRRCQRKLRAPLDWPVAMRRHCSTWPARKRNSTRSRWTSNRLIRSPVISRDDQIRAMAAIGDAAGFSQLTKNFIGVVADNRRLFAVPAMIKAYQTMLAESRGQATAEVVSAKPLSDAQRKAVADALKQAIGTTVQVEERVDASLLGGLVVKVGSRMIDSSLKTKLQQMRLAMKGVG
jgi:F-type H+-transporting ATPase subunit delta